MRLFGQGYIDIPTRYWVFGRLVEAIVLFAFTKGLKGFSINKWIALFSVSISSLAVAIVIILFPKIMPVMLTDRGPTLVKMAMEYIRKIDGMGGAARAIEKGYMQKEIMDAAYSYQMAVEKGDQVVVGVNKFKIDEGSPKGLLKVDISVGEEQKKKLQDLRTRRGNEGVKTTLQALKAAAGTEENLMPYIIDCVRCYATLGEICGVLREVFGEYQQSVIL
jgi:methylmalonyl-CoA mutase cobalamin-binding domain/chain